MLLSRVKVVPPNTGIYITTTEPGCTLEIPTTEEDIYYVNMLQPAVKAQPVDPTTTINGEEFLNFVVGIVKATQKVGFIRLTKQTNVGPNRCVLPVPARLYPVPNSVREIEVVFDDEATGIEEIESVNRESLSGDVYDLQGRRIDNRQLKTDNPLKKGVYIVNGKKVYVK